MTRSRDIAFKPVKLTRKDSKDCANCLRLQDRCDGLEVEVQGLAQRCADKATRAYRLESGIRFLEEAMRYADRLIGCDLDSVDEETELTQTYLRLRAAYVSPLRDDARVEVGPRIPAAQVIDNRDEWERGPRP